jgi:hypothetical protein
MPDFQDRLNVASRPSECLSVAIDGQPATIHHAYLGLIAAHVMLTGLFMLPGGDLIAVYGAEAVPLG